MTKTLFFALAICAAPHAMATQKPAPQKESTTVSAGISKQQLALETKLDEILDQGDQAKRAQDFRAAVAAYEKAKEFVHSERLLAEQQGRVLWKLAGAYLDAQKPSDAVATYRTVLELRRPNCNPKEGVVQDCAATEQMIGLAKMQSGEFAASLTDLRQAVDEYGVAAAHTRFEELKMVAVKDQSEARLLLAVALFRTGKRDEAISENEEALKQLRMVEANANIQAPIRDEARRNLESAIQQLEKLKSQP